MHRRQLASFWIQSITHTTVWSVVYCTYTTPSTFCTKHRKHHSRYVWFLSTAHTPHTESVNNLVNRWINNMVNRWINNTVNRQPFLSALRVHTLSKASAACTTLNLLFLYFSPHLPFSSQDIQGQKKCWCSSKQKRLLSTCNNEE